MYIENYPRMVMGVEYKGMEIGMGGDDGVKIPLSGMEKERSI
jgi:hypothetical protein